LRQFLDETEARPERNRDSRMQGFVQAILRLGHADERSERQEAHLRRTGEPGAMSAGARNNVASQESELFLYSDVTGGLA
jgi:hypothetical protein